MSTGTALTFHLPEGWTLRKVASAMAREWIPPYRAEHSGKAARWVVQSVVENPDKDGTPLWEPGISTDEYEKRMDRADLCWAIRASAGRGKATVLARLAMCDDEATFHMTCPDNGVMDVLFDSEKLSELGTIGPEDLFSTLLTTNGFERTAQ